MVGILDSAIFHVHDHWGTEQTGAPWRIRKMPVRAFVRCQTGRSPVHTVACTTNHSEPRSANRTVHVSDLNTVLRDTLMIPYSTFTTSGTTAQILLFLTCPVLPLSVKPSTLAYCTRGLHLTSRCLLNSPCSCSFPCLVFPRWTVGCSVPPFHQYHANFLSHVSCFHIVSFLQYWGIL